ncbi:hypothetical protein ABNavy97_048 [Acinetobacter phage AB-Navy97]|nr:hypothetical protein ABNavy97_048 [Acinetobacter phage AB-Navy97]
MNMFERRTAVNKEIEERAWEFIQTAQNAIMELPGGETIDVPRKFQGNGYVIHVYDHITSTWPENPHYDPKAPDTPENREKQTGFHRIHVEVPEVNIVCTATYDVWDECAPDLEDQEQWVLNQVPMELFLNGTDEEITAYIQERFKDEADRIHYIEEREAHLPLTTMKPELLRRAADVIEQIDQENLKWGEREEAILIALGVTKNANNG